MRTRGSSADDVGLLGGLAFALAIVVLVALAAPAYDRLKRAHRDRSLLLRLI